jgi:drug/metabolite transporter (DMT)-like permease
VTAAAFGLVLLSAALHVAWNTIARSQRSEPLNAWLLATAGVIVLLPPFLIRGLQGAAPLAPEVLGYAALSGAIETVAFLALTAGYRTSDLSLIYPLSRGLAPVVAAAVGAFAASDHVSRGELGSIGVILAGAAWLALHATSGLSGAARTSGIKWSFVSACSVAGYHLSDRAALNHASQPDTWRYFFTMQLFLVLFTSTWLLARRVLTREALKRVAPLAGRALIGGAVMQVGYWLVLLALKQGASSLVVATRNLGIPMSLAVGALLFHERVDGRRWAAGLLITGGVLLLAWA